MTPTPEQIAAALAEYEQWPADLQWLFTADGAFDKIECRARAVGVWMRHKAAVAEAVAEAAREAREQCVREIRQSASDFEQEVSRSEIADAIDGRGGE